MPRFTIKDLLIATTLIAAGAGSTVFVARNVAGLDRVDGPLGSFPLAAYLWIGGGGLIGTGVFVPFKRATVGAFVGIVIGIISGMFMVPMLP